MSIKTKYFSVEEANAFIPKLLIDIPRIQDLMKRLVNDFPDVRKAREKAQLKKNDKRKLMSWVLGATGDKQYHFFRKHENFKF